MKKDALELLCCPICKTYLDLEVKKEEKDKVLNGVLTCKNCKNVYLIEDGIPSLLPK